MANVLCLTGRVSIESARPGAPGPVPPKLPRFRMLANNGTPMKLAGWKFPVVIDLAGLTIPRQSRPVRLSHDALKGIGHTESIRVDGSKIVASGTISRDTEAAREVVASAKNGFPWQASLGASCDECEFINAGETATVNGHSVEGPMNIARCATLGGISFVDLGADENTWVMVAANYYGDFDGTTEECLKIAAQCLKGVRDWRMAGGENDVGDDLSQDFEPEITIYRSIAAARERAHLAELNRVDAVLGARRMVEANRTALLSSKFQNANQR
jgi:hypothetical protein